MKKIILILLILFFIPLISSAATFGYTTKGGTEWGPSANSLICAKGVTGTDTAGTSVTKMSIATYVSSGTGNFKGVIVESSTKTIITNGITNSKNIGTTPKDFSDFTFATNPTVSNSTNYWVCDISDTDYIVLSDSGGTANDHFDDSSNSYSSPTNPTDGTQNPAHYFKSIYATYEPASTYSRNSTTTINNGRININNGRLNIR
mgnify:CR=1 FL=1